MYLKQRAIIHLVILKVYEKGWIYLFFLHCFPSFPQAEKPSFNRRVMAGSKAKLHNARASASSSSSVKDFSKISQSTKIQESGFESASTERGSRERRLMHCVTKIERLSTERERERKRVFPANKINDELAFEPERFVSRSHIRIFVLIKGLGRFWRQARPS